MERNRKPGDLYSLLEGNPGLGKYYETLPDNIKASLREYSDSIRTEEDFRDYVENLFEISSYYY